MACARLGDRCAAARAPVDGDGGGDCGDRGPVARAGDRMSRTQRFLTGFATGYAHMILATLAGLWLTPFFLHHLGQNTYGLWLVGTQIVAYLLLMDLGVVALLPRETAYVTGRTGRHDAPELRQLIEKALTLACVQTPVVLT